MTPADSLPEPPPRRRSGAIWIAALIGAVFSAVLLYPGQYPFDSAYQLWQARTGEYSNITPVVMPALWSALLGLGGNPASLLLLNVALLWTGLALAFDRLPIARVSRVAGLLVCGLAPTALVQVAHLLSDTHLAAVLVLATGLFIDGDRGRRAPLVIAAMLLVYAGCVRHNAVLAILPLGALLGLGIFPRRRWAALAAAVGIAIGALVAAGVFDRTLTEHRRALWPTLVLWDLAAVSVATGELLLPAYTHGPGLTPAELAETRAFDPTSVAPLFARSRSGIGSGLGRPYPPEHLADLRATWVSMIVHHPREWIAHRLRTFVRLTGAHREPDEGVAYYVDRHVYRDNPELPHALAPATQQSFYVLMATLLAAGALSALPSIGMHLAAIIVAWRRRDTRVGSVAVAIAASALLYTAGFLILAPSTELRYLTWTIVAAPLALLLALASRRRMAHEARDRRDPP